TLRHRGTYRNKDTFFVTKNRLLTNLEMYPADHEILSNSKIKKQLGSSASISRAAPNRYAPSPLGKIALQECFA
ncbi:hypothetical protein, partial [Comamonas sp.]|uniref:hypothetical protein n=1 Tax=Comamonas sp. TaxID=34028 RepID=UPI003A8E7A9A